MIQIRAALLVLLLAAFSTSWAASVLIVTPFAADDESPSGNNANLHVTRLQTVVFSAFDMNVQRSLSILDPASLGGFDQVWDIWAGNTPSHPEGGRPISAAEIQRYVEYLASGKSLVVFGDHSGFPGRNNSVLSLIQAAGGGALTFASPTHESGIQATQVVQAPFTGPNVIGNGDNRVTFAAAGGVASARPGQFITIDTLTGRGTALVFRPGTLSNAPAGTLVVIFDQNIMDGGTRFDTPDHESLLRNIVSYLISPPPPPAQTIGNVLANAGRPFGVAVHNGYAYVADPQSHTVWKFNLSNPTDKTPVAGIGWDPQIDPDERAGYNGDGIDALQAQLNNPEGVAVDSVGNIYIADRGNHAIRKIGAGSTFITTVAGIPTSYAVGESTHPSCQSESANLAQCVPATTSRLFGPRALAVDEDDNVYIVDEMNYQVKKLYTSGTLNGFIFVVAGIAGQPGSNDGPAAGPIFCNPNDECTPGARLNAPAGVAVSGSIVYIADSGNNKIRTVNSDGNVQTLEVGPLLRPTGVAAGGGGIVYIADYGNHRIRRARNCGGEGCDVVTIVGTGTPGSSGGAGDPGTSVQLNSPIAITLDGIFLYIADMLNGRILSGDFTPPVITLQ